MPGAQVAVLSTAARRTNSSLQPRHAIKVHPCTGVGLRDQILAWDTGVQARKSWRSAICTASWP